MKIVRSLITLFFITAIVTENLFARSHQDAPVKASKSSGKETGKPEPKRPENIVIFLNQVRSAQPEFVADLLIDLAESDKITDPAWKCELLEESFRLAPNAQEPFKRKYTSVVNPIDTRAGYLGYAYDLKLDALSLRCRAIKAMLSVNKQKARELFKEIPKLELAPISCESSLVYDVSDFYSMLAAIAQMAFTAKEISRNEPIRFIEPYLSDIVSPVQVEPLINLILAMKPHRDTLETLTYGLSNALPQIASNDRAFWFSYPSTVDAMSKLLAVCQGQSLPPDDLTRAFRAYLIKQLDGEQCADSYKTLKQEIPGLIATFNERIKPRSSKNVSAISPDDVKPSKVEGEEQAFWYWQSSKAEDLLSKIKRLRFGSGKQPLTDAEKQSREWSFELNQFLEDLTNWHKEDEKSEEDYLNQKCFLYRTLVELIPEGPARDDVLRSYVAFLNEFDLQRGSRIMWFWQANDLIKRILVLPEEKRIKLLDKIGAMKNPILYLYVEFKQLKLKSYAS